MFPVEIQKKILHQLRQPDNIIKNYTSNTNIITNTTNINVIAPHQVKLQVAALPSPTLVSTPSV